MPLNTQSLIQSSPIYRTCVLFGGTGFIGSHFALFLLQHNIASRIILADLYPIRNQFQSLLRDTRISYVQVDVRTSPDTWLLPSDSIDLIVNLAAVHREPGHSTHEYFETNLLGAEHVCKYSEDVSCINLIFTSSIAPYGPSEELKTEYSLPTPVTAYGCSKLVAEKIHVAWQRAGLHRRLVIVRPGVIFGQGELGNVTRLVQASLRGYFVYMGNKHTRKAAGYVKELVASLLWILEQIPDDGGTLLYNFGFANPPSVKDFVDTTYSVNGHRKPVVSVPYNIVLIASILINTLTKPFNINHPFSPVRIRKLVRSNNIKPQILLDLGYPYKYSLLSAMRDWKFDSPSEWQ